MLGALALANLFALTSCASEGDMVGDDDLGSSSSDSSSSSESSSSESSSSESSSDSVDSADWSGGSFYAGPSPDFLSPSECDPFAQDCPEGEKCVPYGSTGVSWDANKCVPVTGVGQPGDTCTWAGFVDATDDCGADSVCWDVMDIEGQEVGVCTPFCTGTADAPLCDPGSSCVIANEGTITLCIATCDPLLQDCGPGLACFWAVTDFLCIFTTQDIPTNEPCGFINDCVAGNYCADAATLPDCAGSACCAAFCDLADPLCSVVGTECVSFFEQDMAPPGAENIGICILPP